MDLSKLRGNQKKGDSSSSASPGSDNSNNGQSNKSPKNIMETNTWKKGSSGLSNMWTNYINILGTAFQNYTREEQERLITTLSRVVTMGCATVLITLFYPFIPQAIRLVAVPLILFGSWFVATRIVATIIISQFDDKLNKE